MWQEEQFAVELGGQIDDQIAALIAGVIEHQQEGYQGVGFLDSVEQGADGSGIDIARVAAPAPRSLELR